ncbi:hypothetical protein B566_EDAN000470 [Ephemera danica]|nr:hypothetical protein B566_EDAN000470 [Ephemera danica]
MGGCPSLFPMWRLATARARSALDHRVLSAPDHHCSGGQSCDSRHLRGGRVGVEPGELSRPAASPLWANLLAIAVVGWDDHRDLSRAGVSPGLLHRAATAAAAGLVADLHHDSVLDELPRADLCLDLHFTNGRAAEYHAHATASDLDPARSALFQSGGAAGAGLWRVDPALIEAAWDLYADRWSLFLRVLVPLTKPGIIAGCVLVFIPSLGAYLTPDLLGGARSMMVGNLIQHEYLVARDWPLGSALSIVLMLMVMGSLLWYFHAQVPQRRKRGEP